MNQPLNANQQALQVLAAGQLGQLPASVRAAMAAAAGKPSSELSAGITSGFAIVSLRGKVWRIKHRGEERALVNEQNEPRYSLEVVLVKASENIAKIFYEQGYVEGSTAPPDCWSSNGRVPDPAAPAFVAGKTGPTCVGCWANAWGSRVNNTNGSKGKACSDSKRLAIAPLQDIDNEAFGGPMLLRIPPASLGDVKAYADKLDQMGFPYFAVATRVSFDMTAEYPKLTFAPIRVLSEDEAIKVLALRGDPANGVPMNPQLERILNTALDLVETDGTDKTHVPPLTFEQGQQPSPAAAQGASQAPVAQAPIRGTNTPPAGPQTVITHNGAPVTPKGNAGEVPEGYTALPGGKYFHAPSGQVVDKLPEPPKPDPVVVPEPVVATVNEADYTPLPGGKFYHVPSQTVVDSIPKPAPVVVAEAPLPEGWVVVDAGRWYHPEHGMSLERPTAQPVVAKDPNEGRVPLPGGNFYDPTTGQVFGPDGQPAGTPQAAQQAASPALKRERGKASPGKSRRTKEEMAEDEAADAADRAAQGAQAQATVAQTIPAAGAPMTFEQPPQDLAAQPVIEQQPDVGGTEPAAGFDNMLDGLLA